MRSLSAPPYVFEPLWDRWAHSKVALCPLWVHYVPTMSSTAVGFNRWAHSEAPINRLCGRAQAMRPLCISLFGFRRRAHSQAILAPAHSAGTTKPFWGSIDGPRVGPLCAHYAPTVCVLNRSEAESVSPECAHYPLGALSLIHI